MSIAVASPMQHSKMFHARHAYQSFPPGAVPDLAASARALRRCRSLSRTPWSSRWASSLDMSFPGFPVPGLVRGPLFLHQVHLVPVQNHPVPLVRVPPAQVPVRVLPGVRRVPPGPARPAPSSPGHVHWTDCVRVLLQVAAWHLPTPVVPAVFHQAHPSVALPL